MFIIKNLLEPMRDLSVAMSRRVGTACAVALLAAGVPPELADQVIVAAGVLAGVGFDLGAWFLTRSKTAETKLVEVAS